MGEANCPRAISPATSAVEALGAAAGQPATAELRVCEAASCTVEARYLVTHNRGFGNREERWVCKGHADAFRAYVREHGSQPGVVSIVGPYAPGVIR